MRCCQNRVAPVSDTHHALHRRPPACHIDKRPSALQVIRNYQNTVKSIGLGVVYERLPGENDGGEATPRVATGGKEVWVLVEPGIFSAPTQSYRLAIVEVAAMQQVVSANKMLDERRRAGEEPACGSHKMSKQVLLASLSSASPQP